MKLSVKNKPIFLNNKDFKTIQVKVIFPFTFDENDYAMRETLPGMLHLYTNNYPTEREFSMALDKNFVLACFCLNSSIGNLNFFSFNLLIPDTYSIDDNLLDEQFRLFSEVIYNPKVKDNNFFENELNREIQGIKVNIEKILKDTVSYALIEGKEEIDDVGILSSTLYNHREQIDLVNTENLYKFYLDKVYNNTPLVYVFGNCDNDYITKLCDKYIYKNKFNNYNINFENRFYLKPRNELKTIIKESDFRNSIVTLYYKVRDMKIDDEIYLSTINELLSSPNSRLLNKKLRDESDYVYSSFVLNYNHYGVIGILASINKNNYEDVVLKIKEVINDLRNEELVSELLEGIVERKRIGLIRQLDDKGSLFSDFITECFGSDLTARGYYEKLCDVTAHDISTFIDRLVLDTVYFLKEGENE